MAEKLTYQELLDAGVHFGHLTRKWNPKMAEYIFMENNGIHIIDLNKTIATGLMKRSFASEEYRSLWSQNHVRCY